MNWSSSDPSSRGRAAELRGSVETGQRGWGGEEGGGRGNGYIYIIIITTTTIERERENVKQHFSVGTDL